MFCLLLARRRFKNQQLVSNEIFSSLIRSQAFWRGTTYPKLYTVIPLYRKDLVQYCYKKKGKTTQFITPKRTNYTILLPLRPASMTQKNPQTRKIINYLRCASRRTQRSIDRSEDVFIEYPFCVISVAAVERRLFLLVLFVICNRRSIFLFP